MKNIPTPKDLYDYLKYDFDLQTRYLLNFLNPGTKPSLGSNYYIDSCEYEQLSEKTINRLKLAYDVGNLYDTKLSLILNYSFQWSNTPEGHDYWSSLYTKLRHR